METITIGDKRIGIRTSVLEEKATACNMLCCYVEELKEGFYPWVDRVVQILVPLLKFYFHEEVRKAAVSAMPELLRAGKLAVDKGQAQGRDESYVKQLSDYIISSLVEALNKEPETEIIVKMLISLNECIQVMEVLINLQRAPTEDDDPTISYMLQSWARLCKCLGQEFLPYMSIVMPPLLHSAQLKPDVTITDADDPIDAEIDSDDDSMETITIGDKRIGIRTSVLEEKATACNMLCCYVEELKEGFYPWVDRVVQILVPLLKFYFHEEVRKAAVSAMPELLRAGKLAVDKGQAQGRDESYVKQLSDYIISSLVEALNKEPETEIIVKMLISLNECIQVMEVLINLQRAPTEDDDPTISYMLQSWARLCKCLGQEFLPYMSIVMPPLLHSAQLKPDVTITDADDPIDAEIDSDDDSMETITIGDKRIGIRTSVLEEKATACNMLCCYVEELKEGFYPWVDRVVQILVPLLKFYFHEEVRKAAVSAMPELLRAGKLAVDKGQAQGRDESYVKQLSDYIISSLVEALNKEPETEIIVKMLISLNECIQSIEDVSGEGNVPSILTVRYSAWK